MVKFYPQTMKDNILHRYYSKGESVASLAQESGIHQSTIYRWIKEHQETNSMEARPESQNLNVLARKVQRLEGIIEILQTVNCTANAPLQDRLAELELLYGKYNVHMLCDALKVSRGTFYNHMLRNKRDNTWYAKRREMLRLRIQEIYDESRQIFGAAKITAVLKDEGYRISVTMVRELMRDMGLTSIRQDSKALYDKERRSYKNHLNQQFDAKQPNQIWVSDVTYFRFGDHKFYICVILDLYARKAIACRISTRNSTQLVKSTFKLAYESRNPGDNLIFHTDRGTNFRSKSFCDYLQAQNVTQSFSKAHVPYDNSVMESFFASMKREELYRTKYRSEKEFRAAVEAYIVFYNSKRPHAKNNYATPDKKENAYWDQIADED